MLGAIIGDIVGSRFEWHNHRSKNFEFMTDSCFMTDDSYMTIAVAEALLVRTDDDADLSAKAGAAMQRIGRTHPDCGFGGRFYGWIFADHPAPYNSFGNGSAMRVSPCGFAAETQEKAVELSAAVTRISHDHPEGMKGAESLTMAMYMALHGSKKQEIREYITQKYYDICFTLDEIRDTYQFNETCQESVPQALEAFFESVSFEDAIRNAISIGGDSDTIAAITGGIAEAYYGIPHDIRDKAMTYINEPELLKTIVEFEAKYPPKILKP